MEDSKGKFESIVIIGFYDGKFNEAYKCSEGESERVVLAQILQSAIAQELLDDLMED